MYVCVYSFYDRMIDSSGTPPEDLCTSVTIRELSASFLPDLPEEDDRQVSGVEGKWIQPKAPAVNSNSQNKVREGVRTAQYAMI